MNQNDYHKNVFYKHYFGSLTTSYATTSLSTIHAYIFFKSYKRNVSRIGVFIYSCYLHKIYGISILPNKFVNSLNCMIVSYTICGVLQSIIIFGILFRCFLYKLNFYPFFTFAYDDGLLIIYCNKLQFLNNKPIIGLHTRYTLLKSVVIVEMKSWVA